MLSMAWVTGQTDLAIFDPGSSLLRRFIADESYALDSMERTPLLQATLGHSQEHLRTRHRSVYSAFPTVSCFFLFLVFILVLSSYVFILIYFWVGGLFLLFEDAAKNRLCSPEIHVWLAVALLQPIMNGVCFPRVFDPYCSRIVGWILSLGLILAGANCFTQSYLVCAKELPELYSFVQGYIVFMVVTWLVFLLLPALPYLLVSTGVNLPRCADSALVESMDSVTFDVELFCEDADASDGVLPIECCVCCERFGHEKTIKRTPCKHVFHQDCLSRWLSVTDSCPVCRKELRKVDSPEDPEAGQAECLPAIPSRHSHGHDTVQESRNP